MGTLTLTLKTPYRTDSGVKMYCYRVKGSKALVNQYVADMQDAGTLSQEDDGTPLFHTKFPVLAGTEFVRNEKSGKWYPDNTFIELVGDLSAQNPSLPLSFIEKQARLVMAEMKGSANKADEAEQAPQDPFADLNG